MAALQVLLLLPLLLRAAGSASSSSGPHIADLNVLLPPRTTNPVQHRLLGTGGCFSWTWDHHDILHVEPEYNGSSHCSTSARLISIATYSGRKETAVYAADIGSGTVIRCEVFIDNISRIQIFHHSVKLDLEGLATLQVRAFDSEENVFSSLVGLQFMWQLIPESSDGDHFFHHLVHVPLKETPLTDCAGFCGDLDTQIKLEDGGMGSDLYVVKGIEIGHEIVIVQLLEPQFDRMMDKIVLTVAEAMSLHPPSPVFVIIGSLIQYRLRIIRRNNPKAVDLPSPFHRWSVSNSTVAEVDSLMGFVRALNLGTTSINVEDTRVVGHVQMSTMHVVVPDKLCLYIMSITNVTDSMEGTKSIPPSSMWYVVVGQEYVIHVKVFSSEPDSKEIHITENNELTLESDGTKIWDIFTVSNDMVAKYGWRNSRILKPHSQGQGSVTASLSYHRGEPEIAEVLKVMQQVTICDKVRIRFEDRMNHSQIIHLPWAPGVHQELELKAFGGCARSSRDYDWVSTNPASVSVSSSGFIQAKWLGRAIIKVTSMLDSMNFDEVVVEVSTPTSMVMIRGFPVEALVGTHFEAAVSLKTPDGSYFDRCDAFNSFVKWRVLSVSETFVVSNATRAESASDVLPHLNLFGHIYGCPCSWTYLYASSPGHAMLHATFSSKMQSPDLLFGGQIILQASAPIAAYSILVTCQAGNGNQFGGYCWEFPRGDSGVERADLGTLNELYLVPGTSMDVLVVGGPDRWDHGVEYIDSIEIQAEENLPAAGVTWKQAFTDTGTLYNILCQTVGNFNLVFSRGNLVGDDHPLPAVSTFEMALTCSFPSSITLLVNEQANTLDVISSSIQAERGPGKVRISPVVVANGRTIRLAAVGVHISGRPFANSSSLCLRWELNGCDGLTFWAEAHTVGKSGSNWERFLILENASGLCTVRATVIGLSEKMVSSLIEEAYPLLEEIGSSLSDAVRLQLVSSLRVVPGKVLLYFDREAKVNLSIVGGTCFLDAVINDTQVAEIVQPPESAHCSWMMIAARGLGNAVMTVYDIGLSPPIGTSALVKVADVDWIKIISEDEIGLMEGTTEPFELLAGTDDGNIFDCSMYFYMDIHAYMEDNVLVLTNEEGSFTTGNDGLHSSKFFLRAQSLGLTTFYVGVRRRSGQEIYSQIIRVEVYAPLRIHPDYIFLVPGASYVLALEGGPTFGSFSKFTCLDDETATIDGSSGRLTAMSIGNATIHASIYANGGTLICEAFAKVEVGIPSVMSLHLQSEYLCVGCQMPIYPSFPEGDLFSFYEVCKDYTWSVEDEKVLDFRPSQYSHFGSDKAPSVHSKEELYAYHLNNTDYRFINMLHGRSEGRTKVSVSFCCDFLSSGNTQPMYFKASQSLRVVPELPLALGLPITWVLPPYYTTSDLLPGSSESYRQSDSHHKKPSVMYSLLSSCGKDSHIQQDSIVIVGAKIKTRGSNVLSCIKAKDQSGRSEIAACIRVSEVAQVRATTKGSSDHVAYLSSDDKLEVAIGYTDDLGYPFFEANGVVQLDVKTNYPNLVSIHVPRDDNGSHCNDVVHLQARNRGVALVKIAIDHNPQKSVYILVSVGAQLYPMNPVLYVGHVLKFSRTGDGMNDPTSGKWCSANESVISIDRLSGEAHAHSEGVTQVIFEGPNLKLQTTATVQKMDLVSVNPPGEILTNVPFPTKGYKFSVLFSDLFDHISDANRTDLEVAYDCKVDPSFVGYVKPWSDNATGASYCIFFPYSPKYLVNSLSKFKDDGVEFLATGSNGILFVSIIASPKSAPHISGSGRALFIGGFSVSVDELNLTRGSNKTCITVAGNTEVEIHWNVRHQLSVKPVQKDNFGSLGCAEYEVEVLGGGTFTDKITIMLPATGQTAEVNVSYDDGEKNTPRGRSTFLRVAVLTCLILLILTVLIFLRFLERPDSSRPSGPPYLPVPGVAGYLTPDRRIAHDSQSSPHTPQPFVDYVRRTIDETPYYRREGRRRFDPQRTY
uniref:Nuclear pore membrane glycoprotein 210-like n=2 Tax=Anthurium amnicola TaxID=1678845 RepID=A0A1D1XKT8_9ARAE